MMMTKVTVLAESTKNFFLCIILRKFVRISDFMFKGWATVSCVQALAHGFYCSAGTLTLALGVERGLDHMTGAVMVACVLDLLIGRFFDFQTCDGAAALRATAMQAEQLGQNPVQHLFDDDGGDAEKRVGAAHAKDDH